MGGSGLTVEACSRIYSDGTGDNRANREAGGREDHFGSTAKLFTVQPSAKPEVISHPSVFSVSSFSSVRELVRNWMDGPARRQRSKEKNPKD
jgi:hypothetical protein